MTIELLNSVETMISSVKVGFVCVLCVPFLVGFLRLTTDRLFIR